MNQPSLPNFEEPTPSVRNALRALESNKISAPAYLDVVRKVDSALNCLPAGSVFVVATPNAPVAAWVCDSLESYYAQRKSTDGSSGTLAVIELPQALCRREREQAILAAYVGTPMSLARGHCPPRFELALAAPYFGASPVHQVCSIVSSQSPECYIVSNAHKLSEAGGDINEIIERVKFFIELARVSQKTHVLVAHAAAVVDWLNSGEISNSVHEFWIKPYEPNGASFREFKGILGGFDARIPRKEGFSLMGRAQEIHGATGGCPNRVKMWLQKTLNAAMDRGVDQIDWADMLENSPTESQIRHAKAEFVLIHNATRQPLRPSKPADAAVPAADNKKPKRSTKPGQRTLGRDAVAQPSAA